ncbi:integrase [Streptococcus mitis]|nr:integrase [Streptococcus mitis]
MKLSTYKNILPAMANILAENKIPLKTIMDRVGHSDSEVTTSIYTHVTKNMKDEAITVLDKVMKNIF